MDASEIDQLLARIAREGETEFLGEFRVATIAELGVPYRELHASWLFDGSLDRLLTAHGVGMHAMLCSTPDRDQVQVSPDTAPFARECARNELPAAPLMHTYQHGTELVWRWWVERIRRDVTETVVQGAVVARVTELLMAYVSDAMAITVDAHASELAARTRGASWRQRDTVLAILDGTAGASVDRLSRSLGHDLQGWHVGFVVWTDDPVIEDNWAGLETAARDWALDAAGCQPLLVPVDGRAIWGWVTEKVSPTWPLRPVPAPAGASARRVAIGQPARGLDGFRVTHHEAVQAHQLAKGASATIPAIRHADVATLALLRDDRAQLREFVARTLGGLAGVGEREERLRATVLCYLAEGENVRAAARVLHCHRNTVQQRLDAATELRGRALSEDRLALALALEIADHHGSDVPAL